MTMRILVLQTTRMGDVLQTSPLIHGIRLNHPDAHITVMVRNMGNVIAQRNPDVNDIIVYEEDDMFLDARSEDSDRFLRAYHTADGLLRRLRNESFDMAYNCTHSISSAMLLKLAEIPQVIGSHLTDDWQFVLRGAWINYFYTSIFHREYNDLNLCDITRHFVENAPPCPELLFRVTDEDGAFVHQLFDSHCVAADDFVACFQLGASEENKRWSEAHFAALGRMLRDRRNAKIFLVGVKEEEPLGNAFEQQAPGVAIPLYGRTTLPQLAALLSRSNLLVTNDTGTMHLAAAVKCPILLVSVGYVHFRETGPYGVGHCAIEYHRAALGRADGVPGGLEERTAIRPEQVLRAVDLLLAANTASPVPQIDVEPELAEVDLFMTRFAADGCLEWYPVLRRPLTQKDLLRIAYRAMWLEHLGAQDDPDTERVSLETMLRYFDQADDESIVAWRDALTEVFGQLAALAQRGIRDSQHLLDTLCPPRDMRKAQRIMGALVALDEEMRIFGEIHTACKPLVLISRYERDNLEGDDPNTLARTTFQIYSDCHSRATLTARKIEHILDVLPGPL